MKYTTFKAIFLSLIIVTCSFSNDEAVSAVEKTASIQLNIYNVETERKGNLIISIYHESGWLKMDKAIKQEIVPVRNQNEFTIKLSGIRYPGEYAIHIIHDANENNKMDMRWFPYPKPKEGFAFSNHYVPGGRPKFEKAKFRIEKPNLTISLNLIYKD
jgi:uncharacterized protein (DUF2141 family)